MMFSNTAFRSWPLVATGALLFASLFMLVAMMADLVLEGTFRLTPGVIAFGLAAFVGYVGVATKLREEARESAHRP